MRQRLPIAAAILSASALVGIALHEVYVGRTYLDSGGVPTIGYGTTVGVKPGQTTTPEKALARLYTEAEGVYGAGVKRCITVPLSQNEYDALVDAAYNAGVKAVCSELAPRFNASKSDKDYRNACDSIRLWRATVKGKDCRIKENNCRGLVVRREQEANTCLGETP